MTAAIYPEDTILVECLDAGERFLMDLGEGRERKTQGAAIMEFLGNPLSVKFRFRSGR